MSEHSRFRTQFEKNNVFLLLGTLGESLGADYFAFSGISLTCRLFSSRARACNGVSGPDFPDFENECDGEFPTTGTLPDRATNELPYGKICGIQKSYTFKCLF